ncbi:hypothetical protein HAX54_001163, partial [Datura stramonium]|nr:hypothetical protein [Datura stramonium]
MRLGIRKEERKTGGGVSSEERRGKGRRRCCRRKKWVLVVQRDEEKKNKREKGELGLVDSRREKERRRWWLFSRWLPTDSERETKRRAVVRRLGREGKIEGGRWYLVGVNGGRGEEKREMVGRRCELFPVVFRRPVRWRREGEAGETEGEKREVGRRFLILEEGKIDILGFWG